ncbi:hypothetical protein Mapa_003935 [Marchantia paleacea]|nr:hypothetical protein Mapa_003935 [Marchantia paleacea]
MTYPVPSPALALSLFPSLPLPCFFTYPRLVSSPLLGVLASRLSSRSREPLASRLPSSPYYRRRLS